jgi:hypothetical protein
LISTLFAPPPVAEGCGCAELAKGRKSKCEAEQLKRVKGAYRAMLACSGGSAGMDDCAVERRSAHKTRNNNIV